MEIVNRCGPWVTDKDFFNRTVEVRRLTRLLDDGNHVLVVAPRRVGKTSLVRETFRRMEEEQGKTTFFVDVQDCKSPTDMLVKLALVARKDDSVWRRIRSRVTGVVDRVDAIKVDGIAEIKLRESILGDWKEKGHRILQELRSCDLPVALCFDELPIMVSRMLSMRGVSREESVAEVDTFLSWLRSETLSESKKLRVVLCGSIGIEPILARHGLTHTINHLRAFHLEPWSRETAEECLGALAERYNMEWHPESLDRMLSYLTPYIPHHVQMFFGLQLDDCEYRQDMAPTRDDIDRVYETKMLGTRGHAELVTYEERLRRVLGEETLLVELALAILTEAAVRGSLSAREADLVGEELRLSDPADARRDVMGILEHDGYLERQPSGDVWRFSVPLLRDWWKRRFGAGYQPLSRTRGTP